MQKGDGQVDRRYSMYVSLKVHIKYFVCQDSWCIVSETSGVTTTVSDTDLLRPHTSFC